MDMRPNAAVGVELVVLTVLDDQLAVLALVRGTYPFENKISLPGGIVLEDEDLPEAAERLCWERTRLPTMPAHLEQLATYGAPDRDPRGRAVTVAYLAVVPGLSAALTPPDPDDPDDARDPDPDPDDEGAAGGTDEAEWVAVTELIDDPRSLAFDHHRILLDGVERVRAKLEYTPLASAFCPDEFTIGDLRRVYEAVWDITIDPRNFHRKVSHTSDFVVETGRTTSGESGRPARLYRRGDVDLLHPALLRPE